LTLFLAFLTIRILFVMGRATIQSIMQDRVVLHREME
jgi:hypothetical protein